MARYWPRSLFLYLGLYTLISALWELCFLHFMLNSIFPDRCWIANDTPSTTNPFLKNASVLSWSLALLIDRVHLNSFPLVLSLTCNTDYHFTGPRRGQGNTLKCFQMELVSAGSGLWPKLGQSEALCAFFCEYVFGRFKQAYANIVGTVWPWSDM